MLKLRSVWDLELYASLLEHSTANFGPVLDANAYRNSENGFWLRHDVELSIAAAKEIALLENAMDVTASYFICFQSPFLKYSSSCFKEFVRFLSELGHDVYFHIVLNHSVKRDLLELQEKYPGVKREVVSYHAPGVGPDKLAELQGGETVYRGLVEKSVRYFSDSTGKWRWGNPIEFTPGDKSTIQILTHPFWWVPRIMEDILDEITPDEVALFLPQYTKSKSGS